MSQEESAEFFGDERIEKHLREIAKNASLSKPNFQVTLAVKTGNNFVGKVYRAVVEGEKKDGKIEKICVIVKCAPTDSDLRTFLKIRKLFLREIFFYETVLSVFDDFLKNYDQSIEYVPILYNCSKDDENEILVLEDLKSKGYVMRESKLLDYPHARLALRGLGSFHACSFAIRAKRPDVFEMFKSIEEPLFVPMDHTEEMQERMTVLCNLVRKALADEDDHYRERFDRFITNMADTVLETVKGSAAEPYAVVNHGDAWSNNMLFKYQENEGSNQPQDLRFLDFQLSRYASPALDIAYTLFCSTLHETRLEHYDELLREYYDSFSKCLESLDCDAKLLFPFEKLLEHMERFGNYAASMAIFVMHIFAGSKDDAEELTLKIDAKSYNEKLEKNDFYRSALRDVFKDFVDRNII